MPSKKTRVTGKPSFSDMACCSCYDSLGFSHVAFEKLPSDYIFCMYICILITILKTTMFKRILGINCRQHAAVPLEMFQTA